MWNPKFRDSARVAHSTTTPPPDCAIARNDATSTAEGDSIVEVADEGLFVKFGSLVVEETVAVLVESVAELNVAALTLIVMITNPPTLTEPTLQLTVPALCEHIPCVVEEET